ncbi:MULTISPECIES: NAD(P)/FAD-dependent oxidoreductase [Paracoccaceae]|jgi:sarcosine oxidase subunit beta|uniref:NAD(P)/FAD-dependent oxidoreductase n=1 Tax=Paracoccaceae TaxID=31989 RepID=UPI0030667E1E
MQGYDLIIVGAGIVGLSTAWRAARSGARVLVLDKGSTAYEASSRATGFAGFPGGTPGEAHLAQVSEVLWDQLDDELGYPTEWTQKGRLWAAITASELEQLKATYQGFQESGIAAEFIDGRTCRDLIPSLTADTLGGIHTSRSGHANPQRTSQAFAWAFQDLGGEIRERTPVLEILTAGGKVKGVRTSEGEIHGGAVVLSAAAHNAPLLAPLAIDFPVAPVRLEAFVTAPLPRLFEQAIVAHGLAVRQTRRGNIHVNGGPHEWLDAGIAGEMAKPTTPLVRNIARRLYEVFPALRSAQMLRSWAGVIDVTPDQITLIHPFDTPSGLVACSSAGHGFGLSPALGLALSDLALHGGTNLPIGDLTLARFANLPKDWRRVWNWQPGSYNT